jgi:mycothiol system anti-sigma-R factor
LPGVSELTMDSDKMTARVEVTQVFTAEEVAFDYYSCKEAIVRLNDYLDHELTDAERADVIKHLQICKPCLERFRFEETLVTSLRKKVCALVAPAKLREKLKVVIRTVRFF